MVSGTFMPLPLVTWTARGGTLRSGRRSRDSESPMTSTWLDDPTDKVCVVTGGAGGIGRALAARFLQAGMRIVVADVEPEAISDALDALDGGDRLMGVTHDVRSLDDTHRLRDETL